MRRRAGQDVHVDRGGAGAVGVDDLSCGRPKHGAVEIDGVPLIAMALRDGPIIGNARSCRVAGEQVEDPDAWQALAVPKAAKTPVEVDELD